MRRNAGIQETESTHRVLLKKENSEANVSEKGGLLFRLHDQTLLSSQANQTVNK